MTRSSSWTRVDGISPATILQNRQSATRGLRALVRRCHQSAGFVDIRKAMRPTAAAIT